MYKNAYLSEKQITEMAEAALTTYEVTGERAAALRAAHEHAMDVYKIRPSKTAVLLAYKRAMLGWESLKMQTKAAIASE